MKGQHLFPGRLWGGVLVIFSAFPHGRMPNAPRAPAGIRSYLSDEQHEPQHPHASIVRLDASSGPRGSRFMSARTRLWSATLKLSSTQNWIIYPDLFFSLLHVLFLWVHPSSLYSSGTIGRESPSKGFYSLWHSFPDCDHPPGDFCLSICVLRRSGSQSLSSP